jgi:hypothetical protein
MIWFLATFLLSAGPDEIEDIQPPIRPDTAVWSVAIIALLLLVAIAAYFLWPNPKKAGTPPPLPRELARISLRAAQEKLGTADAYEFSIEVSSILRTFIERQYGVLAVRQTTPEFLDHASRKIQFTTMQHEDLQKFLHLCDSIKFARVEAGRQESETLLSQAWAFVEDGQ